MNKIFKASIFAVAALATVSLTSHVAMMMMTRRTQ